MIAQSEDAINCAATKSLRVKLSWQTKLQSGHVTVVAVKNQNKSEGPQN